MCCYINQSMRVGSFLNQTLWVPKLKFIQIYTEWFYNKKKKLCVKRLTTAAHL